MSETKTNIQAMMESLTNLTNLVSEVRIGQVMDDFHTTLQMEGINPYYLENDEYVKNFCDFCLNLIYTSC